MLGVVCAHRDRPAADIIKAIYDAVQDFCRPGKPLDDVTAIVVKVGPESHLAFGSPSISHGRPLPASPPSGPI